MSAAAERPTTLHNYLRVELVDPARVTAGGIVLPDKAMDRPRWARVLEVGPGAVDVTGQRIPLDFQVGDLVFMFRHAPVKCELDESIGDMDAGNTYFISEGDVLLRIPAGADLRPENVMEHLQPVGYWCIIELMEQEEKRTKGGIILAQTNKSQPTLAHVIRTGAGLRTIAASLVSLLDSLFLEALKQELPEEYHGAIDRVAGRFAGYLSPRVAPTVRPGDTVVIIPGRDIELDLSDIGIYCKYRLIQEGDIVRIVRNYEQVHTSATEVA